MLSRRLIKAADAALPLGSTVSGWRTSFRGEMNRNPRAPQNFIVESLLPKVELPPIDMNENLSWWRAQKKWRGDFLFYVLRTHVRAVLIVRQRAGALPQL